MTELEKKTLKAQTDLVQAVVEAFDKKNIERVEMLISNAIKQLKMSRFKPDQATCLGLTYLAKTNPKIFTQSGNIKELLKSLIRRDQGPTNIKGKSDVVIPVLAANILLACCDSVEIRAIILHKIEQWINGNQKVSDLVQHLLATLCMKCDSDPQTIASLIDIRQHWLQYLDENYKTYGPVPIDLSTSVKKLLESESKCDSLITYLNFLIKHDQKVVELCEDVSRFILERPITLNSMLKEDKLNHELASILLRIYLRLLEYYRSGLHCPIKSEDAKEDVKIRLESVYVKLPCCSERVVISKRIVSATFSLMSLLESNSHESLIADLKRLKEYWIAQVGKINHVAFIYMDSGMSISYDLPDDLRQKLIHSQDDALVEFAMRGASTGQLVLLLQQFSLTTKTINKVLTSLESIQDSSLIRAEVVDYSYFAQLMEFYSDMGCPSAVQLKEKLQPATVSAN